MRRWYRWVGQLVLLGGVAVFVWRSLRRSLGDFGTLRLPEDVSWSLVVASGFTILLTYGLLIVAWMSVLRGWSERLPFTSAARIWCLSNLGRYVPGKIWAFAGMALLAEREGIRGWSAVGAALVMQVLALGTGAAVAITTVAASGATGGPGPITLGAALAVTVATVAALSAPLLVRLVDRLTGRRFNLRPTSAGAVALGAGATLTSWFSYGIALWLLARAFVPESGLSFAVATGAFATGYIVGLMAVVVPGGLGVREGVLLSVLAPWLGVPAAGIVTVASRLMLTLAEVTAALGAMIFSRGRGKHSVA